MRRVERRAERFRRVDAGNREVERDRRRDRGGWRRQPVELNAQGAMPRRRMAAGGVDLRRIRARRLHMEVRQVLARGAEQGKNQQPAGRGPDPGDAIVGGVAHAGI